MIPLRIALDTRELRNPIRNPMTLNITILTPLVIYQSADFRLTDANTGKPRSDPSPKTVTLTYLEWEGFVTYTGIGNWSGRDISAYITEWLTGVEKPSMQEVADVLASKGTALLRQIERRTSHRFGHTFTLAGFYDQVPHVYVVSNFEDCFGNSHANIDDTLTITHRSLGHGEKATVIVTGWKQAVPRPDRRTLVMVATKYPGDGLRIRRRMARVNAAAAPLSKGMVSSECVVLSFRSDGTGVTMLSGEPDQVPKQFPHIANGIDTNKFMMDALKNAGLDISKARLVQAGYASSRPGVGIESSSKPCNYAVAPSDPPTNYKIIEIKSTEFEVISARDINNRGEVVGTGRAGLGTHQPTNIPWSYAGGQVVRLAYSGLASAVNDVGQVTAVLQNLDAPPPSWQRAAVYIDGHLVNLPLYHAQGESPERSDSELGAINNSSLMVGSIAIQYDKVGPLIQLAALFRLDQTLQIFRGLDAKYSCRALDINDQGHVLLTASQSNSAARAIIWNPADDNWHFVGGDTAYVFPTALNDHDVVLGQMRNGQDQPVAVICQPGGAWERLGTPDKWVPADINNQGQVIGTTTIELLQRPWLHEPDGRNGRNVILPHLTDHHTGPSSINNLGQIVGGASADKDFHALLWTTS
jgi:uncharacterized membrane protein